MLVTLSYLFNYSLLDVATRILGYNSQIESMMLLLNTIYNIVVLLNFLPGEQRRLLRT